MDKQNLVPLPSREDMHQALQESRADLAAPQQAAPAGEASLPVEITPQMRKAAADAWLDCGSKLLLNKAAAALKAGIAAAPKAPEPTNTKTHDLLSTMIGMFLGFKETIGYKPGSVIDKVVAEAVEHLKDWPYPEPTSKAPQQAAPAVPKGKRQEVAWLSNKQLAEELRRDARGGVSVNVWELDEAARRLEAAPQQEVQAEPVVAAVFDEQLGRPVLVEGAPLLKHGQPLYTAQPAPSGDVLDLLQEVAACFTRDDDLPDNLLPRIDAVLAARKEGNKP